MRSKASKIQQEKIGVVSLLYPYLISQVCEINSGLVEHIAVKEIHIVNFSSIVIKDTIIKLFISKYLYLNGNVGEMTETI